MLLSYLATLPIAEVEDKVHWEVARIVYDRASVTYLDCHTLVYHLVLFRTPVPELLDVIGNGIVQGLLEHLRLHGQMTRAEYVTRVCEDIRSITIPMRRIVGSDEQLEERMEQAWSVYEVHPRNLGLGGGPVYSAVAARFDEATK